MTAIKTTIIISNYIQALSNLREGMGRCKEEGMRPPKVFSRGSVALLQGLLSKTNSVADLRNATRGEHIWDEASEKGFTNCYFEPLDAVEVQFKTQLELLAADIQHLRPLYLFNWMQPILLNI